MRSYLATNSTRCKGRHNGNTFSQLMNTYSTSVVVLAFVPRIAKHLTTTEYSSNWVLFGEMLLSWFGRRNKNAIACSQLPLN